MTLLATLILKPPGPRVVTQGALATTSVTVLNGLRTPKTSVIQLWIAAKLNLSNRQDLLVQGQHEGGWSIHLQGTGWVHLRQYVASGEWYWATTQGGT